MLESLSNGTAAVVRPAEPSLTPEAQPMKAAVPLSQAARRRRRRQRQEFVARITVSILILLFKEVVIPYWEGASIIRLTGLSALLLNGPYYLALRTGRGLRMQAYVRMLVDVALLTAGLYGAGGLAAAPYIAVYMVVPVYAAFVFSSRASAVATMFATVSYLTIVVLQTAGLLSFTHAPAADAAVVAAFNLLVLNIVGWLAALLAEAYRTGRQRLTTLNVELERAHDESLRMNSQIQRAARRYVLGEVVAGVTHEVRNALQGAFGHLWLAGRKPGMPPEALEHLKQVEEACEDAMRILKNTLDLAPRPEPDRQPVVLAEVARHVAEVKSFDLRRDGITLRVDVPETLPLVRGAAFQLEQVVLNLVVNAQDELRGRPGRREIAILGSTDGGRAVLEVHDSGPGIAPAALNRLFEPFYTTKPGGAGLGLAISAGIVEAFGGKLTADNRRRAGAIFRLELPAAAPEDIPAI